MARGALPLHDCCFNYGLGLHISKELNIWGVPPCPPNKTPDFTPVVGAGWRKRVDSGRAARFPAAINGATFFRARN